MPTARKPAPKKPTKAKAEPELLDNKALEELFTAKKPNDKIKRLTEMHQARLNEVITRNFKEARMFKAIDVNYDVVFDQSTPAVIKDIINRVQALQGKPQQQLEAASAMAKFWNIPQGSIIDSCEADGKIERRLHDSTYSEVTIPLAKSYTTIRWAKLYNDRNNYPLLPYEPVLFTEENRARTEIITRLVQQMAQNYGYASNLRQVILQTLMYPVPCFMFPVEAWHCERRGKEGPCAREGLRHIITHPAQTGWDRTCPPSTFNTNSGAEWACHWAALKYGHVADNPLYWNKDRISFGGTSNWFDSEINGGFFTDELYPCTITSPFESASSRSNRRDKEAQFYSTSDFDRSIFVTQMFSYLNPRDWGLGARDWNTWFRFVLASDGCVIRVEPLEFRAVLCSQYDADQNRARNASFTQETIPWQNTTSNSFSQMLMSMKQNALKMVAFDEYQISAAKLRKIMVTAERAAGLLFLPFDSQEFRKMGKDIGKMFEVLSFPTQNVGEQIAALSTTITIMERALQMSSQEVGAPAVHVQTAEETRTISQNTSNRVDLTGSFIDDFTDAWKVQIYEASMSYMDEKFVAQVSGLSDESIKELKELGFEFGKDNNGRMEVRGKKNLLQVSAFVTSRTGANRFSQPQVAQTIFTYLAQVVPVLVQNIQDPKVRSQFLQRIVTITGRAARMAGVPADEVLTLPPIPEEKPGQPSATGPPAPAGRQTQPAGPAANGNGDGGLIRVAKQIEQETLGEVARQLKPHFQEEQENKKQLDQTTELTLRNKQEMQQIQQQVQMLMGAMQKLLAVYSSATAAPPVPAPNFGSPALGPGPGMPPGVPPVPVPVA